MRTLSSSDDALTSSSLSISKLIVAEFTRGPGRLHRSNLDGHCAHRCAIVCGIRVLD